MSVTTPQAAPDGRAGTGAAVVTGVGLAAAGLRDARDLLEPQREVEAPFDPGAEPLRRGMRHKDRASRLALWAADRALRDAGLHGDSGPHPALAGAAVVVSSNFGNLDTVCDFTDTIQRETVTGISPMRVPHMSSNVTACWVAMEFGMTGPNITLCSGTTGGLDAMYWAGNLVAARRAGAVLVVGVEPRTAPVERLHAGAHGVFDGAVALVVERESEARARRAAPGAVLAGYGRAPGRAAAVRLARRAATGPVGLWLSPDDAAEPALDLTARLGRCSGALGVLQCAAGVTALRDGAAGPVLAVAGSGTGDAPDGEGDRTGAAALALTRPRTEEGNRT